MTYRKALLKQPTGQVTIDYNVILLVANNSSLRVQNTFEISLQGTYPSMECRRMSY